MERVWVTRASPTVQAVVDPVTAACEQGFVPTTVHLVRNPSVEEAADEALRTIEAIVDTYGESVTTHTERLADERDFEDIAEYYRDAVTDAPADSEIAVDLTPGRKFMAAMAFQAARQFDADRIHYLYIHDSKYYDRPYPEVPRTAVDLIDFTEVIG